MARKTQAQLQAERLLQLEQEKKTLEDDRREYTKRVQTAMKDAGYARADVVEQLYELFDIKPVTTQRRLQDGTVQQVAADKAEAQRSVRLVEAIISLMDEHEELTKLVAQETGDAHSSASIEEAAEAAEYYSNGHREHHSSMAVPAQL